jgi:hypothetical protein
MRLYFLIFLAGALAASAFGQSNAKPIQIKIANPGFEEDVILCLSDQGCAYEANISGWLCGPATGVFKPAVEEFPNGIPGGVNVAVLGNNYTSGSISQTVPALVRANALYTLTLSIGNRADYPLTGYVASLNAGNVSLSSDNSLAPAFGTFLTDVIVYKSGPNPDQLGQPLQISIKSVGGGQVNVDNVSLTVE